MAIRATAHFSVAASTKTTRKLVYLRSTAERKYGDLAHANGKVSRIGRELDRLAKQDTVATQQQKQQLIDAAEKLAVKAQRQLVSFLEKNKSEMIDAAAVSDKAKRETLGSLKRELGKQKGRIEEARKQANEAAQALAKLGYGY